MQNLFTNIINKFKRTSTMSYTYKIIKLINFNCFIDTILFETELRIKNSQAIQKTWLINVYKRKMSILGKVFVLRLTFDYVTSNVYCKAHKRYYLKVLIDFLIDVLLITQMEILLRF